MKQTTLANAISIEGTSLHQGKKALLTLKPAPENHGFRFVRTDLEGNPSIQADATKVKNVQRATTLEDGSVVIQTVEHILSALTGMGVDNAIIEMDGSEPPIVDGSALPFVEMIEKVGIVEQNADRKFWQIQEPLYLETGDQSTITIVPDKEFRITVVHVGPNGDFTQYFSAVINPETYKQDIASARTFVFYEDVKLLEEQGLIKGGSIENAVVIQEGKILSKEGLRFHNELARHKALDIIGDLILAGTRITGHVICTKPGHHANTKMALQLQKEYSKLHAVTIGVNIPKGKAVLDIQSILKILPHRYPFLLVDRIIDFDGEDRCTGIKNVTMNEPFFQGHFPNHPIMPGVLQLEAMAQVSSILMLHKPEDHGKIGYFVSADKVKFRRPVTPGDTIFIEAHLLSSRRNIGTASCQCKVNGEVASSAEIRFAIM